MIMAKRHGSAATRITGRGGSVSSSPAGDAAAVYGGIHFGRASIGQARAANQFAPNHVAAFGFAGAKVMVVSHGGTTRMFRYLLERWTYDDVVDRWSSEPISNCGVVAYRFDPEAGRLVPADQSGPTHSKQG